MINDLHALYAEKQKQYQDYLVEKRVHEQKCLDATENLKKIVIDVRKALESVNDNLADNVKDILDRYESQIDNMSADTVMQFMQDIQQVSSALESEIREALA